MALARRDTNECQAGLVGGARAERLVVEASRGPAQRAGAEVGAQAGEEHALVRPRDELAGARDVAERERELGGERVIDRGADAGRGVRAVEQAQQRPVVGRQEQQLAHAGVDHREEACRRAGAAAPLDAIDYYVVLARFKMACVLEGGYARYVKGGADNPKMASFGQVVLDMARRAAELAATSKLPDTR